MNKLENLQGRRIHIAGSADPSVDPDLLDYTQQFVRELSFHILEKSGGLVVTIGNDPTNERDPPLSTIFDWTILETVEKCHAEDVISWSDGHGIAVIAVGLPNWRDKIPKNRLPLWDRLSSSKFVELIQVRSELGVGGILREKQSEYGDILVTIGGGPGVNHLAELYFSRKRPVIPLDIPLKGKKVSASEKLFTKAMEDPSLFFECESEGDATRILSRLSIENKLDVEEYVNRFFELVNVLKKPKAFYIRLINEAVSEFEVVEYYFRNVVDEVIQSCGYERFESGFDTSKEPFLDLEIFLNLHYSSLAIVDLTGIRPNCCIEFGYALGQKKKFILMAQEGTKLPFDTKMIPCLFWSTEKTNNERKKELLEFMEKNIDRRPIVP